MGRYNKRLWRCGYWYFAANGLLTRYDYQQDSDLDAPGENCCLVEELITVTSEGNNVYPISNVSVTTIVTVERLEITYPDADKNDLDEAGDTKEKPL